MKRKIFTLLTLLLCVCSGAWATTFTFDVSTDFNDLKDAQKDAIISNGILSVDKLISISFSNPGTDFQRDASGIKMRGGSGRNATITISGGFVATISEVILTYTGSKRNIVSDPNASRTDDDSNKKMTWTFSDVSTLTLSQNIGNTVLTKIEVTYASTGIGQTYAIWDFQNGNPASLATEAIGIEGKEADVTSSVGSISMHVNAKNGAAYDGVQGKLNYRSENGDAQCNRGTVIQIPVKGNCDVVTINPKSGSYTIAGGSEVTSKTTYTATAADVAQGYVEIICSTAGYLYSISVTQYSAEVNIGATGWSTFASTQALDFEHATKENDASADLAAYMVTGFSGTALTRSDALNNAPAGTGLLLNGTAGETYTIPVLASSSTVTTSNKMVASVTGGTVEAGTGSTVNYVLMNNGGSPEFQWIGSTSATLGANKAYLALDGGPKPVSAPGLWFDFGNEGETTGINAVKGAEFKVNGEYYNLAGQRVAQPTKGLYIVNGRKVVIK